MKKKSVFHSIYDKMWSKCSRLRWITRLNNNNNQSRCFSVMSVDRLRCILRSNSNNHHHQSRCFSVMSVDDGGDHTTNTSIQQEFKYFPNIDKSVVSRLHALGYHEPTAIQVRSYPVVTNQRAGDLVCIRSETGSGKTLAFLVPIINSLKHRLEERRNNDDPSSSSIDVLIIVPSRELALQTRIHARRLLGLSDDESQMDSDDIVSVWRNDTPTTNKQQSTKLPSIVISTPKVAARIIHKSRRLSRALLNVKYIVLDEVDGLLKPLSTRASLRARRAYARHPRAAQIVTSFIWNQSSSARLVAVSAVLNARVRHMLRKHGWCRNKPHVVRTNDDERALSMPPNVEHKVMISGDDQEKLLYLRVMLQRTPMGHVLIIVRGTDGLNPFFNACVMANRRVVLIHEQLDSYTTFYGKFQSGEIDTVVCTDDVARGLDFPFLTHVLIMHVPQHEGTYLHLSGRVGRMHQTGTVVTFANEGAELDRLQQISTKLAVAVTEWRPPHHG